MNLGDHMRVGLALVSFGRSVDMILRNDGVVSLCRHILAEQTKVEGLVWRLENGRTAMNQITCTHIVRVPKLLRIKAIPPVTEPTGVKFR